jgi:uncharacterized membrane protein YgaE (UPF0421/DUF939 family)
MESEMSSDTTARLAHARTELATILEIRMSELLAIMKETEQEGRKIVSAELEIARQEKLRSQLLDERDRLARKAETLSRSVGALRAQNEEIKQALAHLGRLLSRADDPPAKP